MNLVLRRRKDLVRERAGRREVGVRKMSIKREEGRNRRMITPWRMTKRAVLDKARTRTQDKVKRMQARSKASKNTEEASKDRRRRRNRVKAEARSKNCRLSSFNHSGIWMLKIAFYHRQNWVLLDKAIFGSMRKSITCRDTKQISTKQASTTTTLTRTHRITSTKKC